MAGTVMSTLAVAFAAASLLAALPAGALGPTQPFTPPAVTRGSVAAAPADAPAAVGEAAASGLMGVRLGSSPRALIDGEWVALGAPARKGRLTEVRAHEVVLRLSGGGTERLALFPPLPAVAGSPLETGSSIVKRDLP